MNTVTDYIWDLDGTLLDSYGPIVGSLVETGERYGFRDDPAEILLRVKRGSVSGYLRETAEGSNLDYGELYALYREISHRRSEEITLIPGAAETLEALRQAGARHYVYTHRGSSTGPVLKRLGLDHFFTETITFENGFRPKPSGEAVAWLVEKYGLDPARTAYVGDRALDVLCAKDAGVQAVLFLPESSCVLPTGAEDRIIRRLEELAAPV